MTSPHKKSRSLRAGDVAEADCVDGRIVRTVEGAAGAYRIERDQRPAKSPHSGLGRSAGIERSLPQIAKSG